MHVCVRHAQQDKNVSAVWPFGEMRNKFLWVVILMDFNSKIITQMYDLVTFVKL